MSFRARLSPRNAAFLAVPCALLLTGAVVVVGTNVNVTSSQDWEEEVDLTIHPGNPNSLLGGSNSSVPGSSVYTEVLESANGGASWSKQYLALGPASGYPSSADPAVAIDRTGNRYFAAIVVNYNTNAMSLAVFNKPANATSWSAGTMVPNVYSDKEFITVDTTITSPCADIVYVAWDNNEQSGQTLRVARSTNGGQSFTTAPPLNDSEPYALGAMPVVHPDGTVIVAWSALGSQRLMVDRSTDCGVTWGTDRTIHTYSLPMTCSSGLGYCPQAAPNRGIVVFARMAVDLSAAGVAHRGRVYVVYNDYSANQQNVDVYLRYSDDKGTTWSSALKVNDDTGNADQFLPVVAVDRVDGTVHVAFYDTRDDVNRNKVHVYYAESTNGGASFLPNVRVSSAQSDHSNSSPFSQDGMDFGEYMGIAASGGRVQVLWADNRNGGGEVYTAPIINGLTIVNTSLPDALVGRAYTGALAGSAGTLPYTWSATGLPPSLSLDSATGAITGTPPASQVGNYTVNVTLKDASNTTVNRSLALVVRVDPVTITNASLVDAQVNVPYGTTLVGQGGAPPYTWAATGLPTSMTLNTGTGALTGTPTAADARTHTVNVTLTDSVGTTATKSLSLAVKFPPLTLATPGLPSAGINLPYQFTLQAGGGHPPYTWSATGLPSALSLNTSTGAISGTCSAGDAGAHSVVVILRDTDGAQVSKTYQLVVTTSPLAITTTSLPNAQEDTDYAPVTLQRSGGAAPYAWAFAPGYTPPQGLSLSTAGVLSGHPATNTGGTYSLAVVLSDASSPVVQVAYATLPLVIFGAPVANAGDDRTVDPGQITLDGTKSYDPAGRAITYQWRAPPGVVLSSETEPSPTFTATRAVDLDFTLVVTAQGGRASTPATVRISVRNVAPVVRIAAPPTLPVQQPAVLDGSATSDANGDSIIYSWSQLSGPGATLSSMATSQTGFTPSTAGTYVFQLTASDGRLSAVGSATIEVTQGCGCGAGSGPEATLGGALLLALGLRPWRRRR